MDSIKHHKLHLHWPAGLVLRRKGTFEFGKNRGDLGRVMNLDCLLMVILGKFYLGSLSED